ncbi:MAG: hypothetical protein NXI31_25565 [bacterium]|nr:hypothetical protein [bacterium]
MAGLLPLGQPHGLLDVSADPAWIGVTLGAQAVIHPTAAPGAFDSVLAGLPSPAGPHLAQVAAMSTGAWSDLGVPQPDPVHGLATGREYTPRMAWSPSPGARS